MPDPVGDIAFRAQGIASEALSAMRAHERFTALQIENMQEQHKDLKRAITSGRDEMVARIEALERKMEDGFRSYDSKFWSLAITTILVLLGAFGTAVWYVITHGVH